MYYAINISMIFTELPLLQRPAAARAAGFGAVECCWPFDSASPSEPEVGDFVDAVQDAGVRLTALDLFAGDVDAGQCGVVSWPGRAGELHDSVAVAVAVGEQLGCRTFNALYGNRVEGLSPAAQDELAVANLALCGAAVAGLGGVVVLEPLSGVADYPLRTARDAVEVLDRVAAETGTGNVGLLCDIYHLAVNADDLDTAIATFGHRVEHVQLADAPGRNEPGTGLLDTHGYLGKLQAAGYRGVVGLEYRPSGPSSASFGWLAAMDGAGRSRAAITGEDRLR